MNTTEQQAGPPEERRTPRTGDDLFWFAEAKKAYAEITRLKEEAAVLRAHRAAPTMGE